MLASFVNKLALTLLIYTARQVFYNPLAESGMLTEQEFSTVFINWKELIWCNTRLLKYAC